MKLITFKPIAFLLRLSAEYFSFNNLKENVNYSANKNISFSINAIVASKTQQKSIGICNLENFSLQIKNYITNNILVGKDKSVVTICKMNAPTATILQL